MPAVTKRPQWVGWSIVSLAVFNLVLIGYGLIAYPEILEGGSFAAISTIGLILMYGAAGYGLTRLSRPETAPALLQSIILGFASGIWLMILLVVEDFTDWISYLPHNALALYPFGILLLIYVLAGWRGAQQTGNLAVGLLVATLSAMISVLSLVIFGLLINYLFSAHLEQILYGDYVRSGMHNPAAFALFNSLDAASSHLFMTPILGIGSGLLGGVVGQVFFRPANPQST
jgi:hypothetical protein